MRKKGSVGSRLTILLIVSELILICIGLIAIALVFIQIVASNCTDDAVVLSRQIISSVTTDKIEEFTTQSKYSDEKETFSQTLADTVSDRMSVAYIGALSTDGQKTSFFEDSTETVPNSDFSNMRVPSQQELKLLQEAYVQQQMASGYVSVPNYGYVYAVFCPIGISSSQRGLFFEFCFDINNYIVWMQQAAVIPAAMLIILFLLQILFVDRYIRKKLVEPSRLLSKEAREYMINGYDEKYSSKLEELNLKSYAELEELKNSMVKMSRDVDEYVKKLRNVRWESEHDAMTMLHNRAMFRKRMDEVYPYADSIYIAYLDVNNLKEMNDIFGHSAGDAIIKKLAEKLRVITSDKIHTYRWGGDEFLIVMCDFAEEEAKQYLETWYNRIGRLNRQEDPIQCTVAYGAAYASGEFLMETIVSMADDAMYRTKTRQKREERRKKVQNESVNSEQQHP